MIWSTISTIHGHTLPPPRQLSGRVREVLGSIPSQGLRHTKGVIKMVPE